MIEAPQVMPVAQMEGRMDELPDEVLDLVEAAKLERRLRTQALGLAVAKKRDEAVEGRKSSGIEEIWDEDDEYYEGIDDANRDTARWIKPAGTTGGIYRDSQRNIDEQRCTAFFNKTRQFVDAASARMGDILLPVGDWNFSIKATPVPSMAQQAFPAGQPLDITTDPMAPKQHTDEEAAAVAERAERLIRDWLVESSDHSQCRMVMEDAARLGTGVIKGPVPGLRKSKSFVGGTVQVVEEVVPISTRVPLRNFFPDPNCKEDIHRGRYVLERDEISCKRLRELAREPGYDAEAIRDVLDEGPGRKFITETGNRVAGAKLQDDDLFEIWYFYGDIEPADLEAMGEKPADSMSKLRSVPAVVTLVNETVIKAVCSPLESGAFPYHVFCWQARYGFWAGIGVARQCRIAQDMLNASARCLMDNMGLSGGPIIVFRDKMVEPMDGRMTLGARKVFRVVGQYGDQTRIDDIFRAIDIPSRVAEFQVILQLADKMFEEATGMFYLLQGQQGAAPDTVGGMEMLHKNANAVLRRVARVMDERVTEPRIREYYEWLMLYGPDDCKGDLQIEAIGSTSLVDREIQAMQSVQLLQLSVNPAYGLDPEYAMMETLKGMRLQPVKWQMSEEKKAKLAQQQPVIPQVEAAKIAAQSRLEAAQIAAGVTVEKTKADTDRDVQYTNALIRRDAISAQQRIEELKLKREKALIDRELSLLNYATKNNIALTAAKAELAKTTMKLRTTRELSLMKARADQMDTPPVEPAGRAEAGGSYEG